MKKKPPVIRFPNLKTVAQPDDRHWHNGGDIEIMMYARSLHRTAMKLVASLDLQPNPKTAWDACPVILLYRESVELYLKALVDEGGDFLKERTDSISLAKTHCGFWRKSLARSSRRLAGKVISSAKVYPVLPTSAPWSTNSKPWTRWPLRCVPVTVVVMGRCRLNWSHPTWFDSQEDWTASWICWRQPQMGWRRRGICSRPGFHQSRI